MKKVTPQKYLDASKKARRAITGRRAVQGQGALAGLLIPVKTEVPTARRLSDSLYQPCDLCPKRTRRPPDATGRRVCVSCRPRKGPPKRGLVAKLCVRCDGDVHVPAGAAGPFLCDRCRRFLTTGRHTKYEADTPTNLCPAGAEAWRKRRVDQLTEMYEAVFAAGSELAARMAGLPTTLDEFPLSNDHDQTANFGDDDGGDPEDDGG